MLQLNQDFHVIQITNHTFSCFCLCTFSSVRSLRMDPAQPRIHLDDVSAQEGSPLQRHASDYKKWAASEKAENKSSAFPTLWAILVASVKPFVNCHTWQVTATPRQAPRRQLPPASCRQRSPPPPRCTAGIPLLPAALQPRQELPPPDRKSVV